MFALMALVAVAYAHPDQLVDTAWVAAHAGDANVRIVDMRQGGYADGHVPGAMYLSPVAIRDAKAAPTFLPTPAAFQELMAKLGVSDSTRVVAYDERGGLYAARLWWILNYYGHPNVALMDGGWTKWTAEHRDVSRQTPSPAAATFTPRAQPQWIATVDEVVKAIGKSDVKIVDARTQAEIDGKDLRNIKRGGFVPSSVPVYWEDLLDPQTKAFKPAAEIAALYRSRGIVPAQQVIAYCQVGMRASVDLFALHLVGYEKLRNYYGAWEEWGSRDDLPLGVTNPKLETPNPKPENPIAIPVTWDVKAAAAFMDGRQTWWQSWPNAARDHETFCVSCHTAMPYAIGRPALRSALGERGPSVPEQKLIENVVKRVTMWRDVEPWYPDQTRGIPKTSESRGTESVFDALILAMRDAQAGKLSDDTRTAFANMWALQMRTQDASGSWAWINFHYEPWESPNSPYFGASMAAIAVGAAPEGYASSPAIADNLKLLRDYFKRDTDKQNLFNRVMGLWASTKVENLLTREQQKAIIDAALEKQQSDGGWSTASLGAYQRVDNTALDTGTDGYATGLVTLALQAAGIPASDPRVAKGLAWLRANQNRETGQWIALSLNKNRDLNSDIGKFMSDAATAYAVLALTQK
jgi:squalene-hopene/tetraprenyl-beta-curcumene cyclase